MLLRVPDRIECALLFDEPCAQFDGAFMLKFLDRDYAMLDFELRNEEEGKYMVFVARAHPLYLLIQFSQQPLHPEDLRKALSSPFMQMTSPGLEKAVERHSMYVLITVSTQSPILRDVINAIPEDLASSLKDMVGKPLDEFPAVDVENKINFCYLVASFLAKPLEPIAIYWSQSDQLLSPESFHRNSNSGLPAPLHLHPYIYSTGTAPDGRRTTGFVTLGARYVIGREIHFKESAAIFPWAYSRALMLLQMAYENDRNVIPDGHSFGHGNDEIIRVRHVPKTETEVALLELTVEKSVEQGIGTPPPPQQGGFGQGYGSPGRPIFGRRKPN